MTVSSETGMNIIIGLLLFIYAILFFVAFCVRRHEIYKRDKAIIRAEKAGLAVIVTAEEYMKLNAKDGEKYPIDVRGLDFLYHGNGYIRILRAEYLKLYKMAITHGEDVQRANCQRVRESINKVLTEEGGADQ